MSGRLVLSVPPDLERSDGQSRPSSQNQIQSRFLVQSIRLEESPPPRVLRTLILLITLLLGAAIVWAAITPVNEVAKAQGEVVPAGSIQAVQHLEGGIVSEILVRDGDIVEAGDILMRLSPSSTRAELDQIAARRASLLLEAERLRAFAANRQPDFEAIGAGHDELVRDQQAIHTVQETSRDRQLAVLNTEVERTNAELALLSNRLAALRRQEALLVEELEILRALAADGIEPAVELLGSERELERLGAEIGGTVDSIFVTENALAAAIDRVDELEVRLRSDALTAMGDVTAELAEVSQTLVRLNDRVDRLDIRTPVRGIVKGLEVRTINAVIAPGELIMEIVPLADELVVEARVSPRDVGHVEAGQRAEVRVSSYDFARFGSVAGEVRQISAATFLDEATGEPFYRVVVALEQDHVGTQPERNRIIPGMTVEADILTGAKTILEYLLRPVYRGLTGAFHER